MLQRTKYNKSDEYIKYKSNSNISYQPSKYHHKKKSTLAKKSSHPWKKQNSYKNWNKENDPNYLNYDYNHIPKEKKEKNNNHNISKHNKYFQKTEKNENFEKNKNDKKFSFDNDATTQSNSSTHEHEENYENKNFAINMNYMCKNNSNNKITNYHYRNNNNEEEIGIFDETKKNKDINKKINEENNINNTNDNIIISSFKNLNLNSNSNSGNFNNKKKLRNTKRKKTFSSELKKSFSDNITEPYNKFNTINNELLPQNINPILENTEILKIKVKMGKDKFALFKLRRFDDLFLTVKLFCEINSIEEKLIRPIITMVLCGLNSIYQIYNTKLEMNNINILRMVKNFNDFDVFN